MSVHSYRSIPRHFIMSLRNFPSMEREFPSSLSWEIECISSSKYVRTFVIFETCHLQKKKISKRLQRSLGLSTALLLYLRIAGGIS